MPAPLAGAPFSGHAWKWNCRTVREELVVACVDVERRNGGTEGEMKRKLEAQKEKWSDRWRDKRRNGVIDGGTKGGME